MSKEYVREFQRWNGATPNKKIAIAIEQAAKSIDTGPVPDYAGGDTAAIMDTIMACGKRLGDCHKADLEAMSAWHQAIGTAHNAFAKAYERASKPRLVAR